MPHKQVGISNERQGALWRPATRCIAVYMSDAVTSLNAAKSKILDYLASGKFVRSSVRVGSDTGAARAYGAIFPRRKLIRSRGTHRHLDPVAKFSRPIWTPVRSSHLFTSPI